MSDNPGRFRHLQQADHFRQATTWTCPTNHNTRQSPPRALTDASHSHARRAVPAHSQNRTFSSAIWRSRPCYALCVEAHPNLILSG